MNNTEENARKVLTYLTVKGDKTEFQIRRACGLSGRQWIFARRWLLDKFRIGIVNKGISKRYTVLNIERTR